MTATATVNANEAPPRTGRRAQADRRRETREKVLDAVVAVLVDKGYAGLTTTDVAQRAGVSRGAQAHYFRTRDDMIVAVTNHLMEQGTALAAAAAESALGSADPVAKFLDDAAGFFFHPVYTAMIELVVASRTHPELGRHYLPLVRRWRGRIDGIWLTVFQSAGIPDKRAAVMLQMTNNMMRGIALTSLWDDDIRLRRKLIREWRRFV